MTNDPRHGMFILQGDQLTTALDKLPNVQLATLDDAGVHQVAKTFDWVIATIAGGPRHGGRRD